MDWIGPPILIALSTGPAVHDLDLSEQSEAMQ
jgi:hypothetical protein